MRHIVRPAARMRVAFRTAVLCATAVAGSGAVHAAYPDKPVRLIVSYAAGNTADIVARIVADAVSTQWKQSIVVDNRPGQGGSLGAQAVARAPADGHTLLFSAMAAFGINPHVYPNVGYDPLRDFVPVVGVAYPNGLLVTHADLPASTLAEVVALSRAKPGSLHFGSAGSGTVPHLNLEALKARTGLDATHVPYKAAMAVTTDLIGGRIQLYADAVAVVLPHVRAGKLKPLAAMSKERLAQLPEVPAIVELLAGFEPVTPWMGLLAPAGTPRDVVERVHREVTTFLRSPAGIERLTGQGQTIMSTTPAEFAGLVASEHERLGRMVKSLKLKVD